MSPNATLGEPMSVEFDKVSGNAYPSSDSLYGGGTSGDSNSYGATFDLSFSPLANVSSIVLQVQIGAAFGYDFVDGALPVLSVNGTPVSLLGDEVTHQAQNGFYLGLPVYVDTYGLQWDLSRFSDPVIDLEISFDVVQHSQLYGLRLDQSDSVIPSSILPIPEPSGLFLCAFAFSGFVTSRRRTC
ncbi:hypothetical protein [Roseibacillus persicicus]|nr:hypothetical protein [Roseibacillus persicicus]